ncbi:MAG: hypothetical protein IJP29_01750 [Lachnospiraceae bacterium]|nr:hypothetical protein [Lachnospiraceae bacterium]
MQVIEQYQTVISNPSFDYYNWGECVKALSPIVIKLIEEADARIALCDNRIEKLEQEQCTALDKRADLYKQLELDKSRLSELETQRLGILQEISSLTADIQNNRAEIQQLQNTIEDIKKENEYWDTVFWATCWIPFANIGTGIKKHIEDGKYYARAKVLGEDIHNKERRIEQLNTKQQEVVRKQRENQESSSSMGNQISMMEGAIAAVTNSINELRKDMNLWLVAKSACSEISVYLQNSNGKWRIVEEGFDKLKQLEQMFSVPTTDKYIKGCQEKGDILLVGDRLNRNEYLISKNRRFVVVMQSDNNLVVYNSEKPLWASHTEGFLGNAYLELDCDGLGCLKGIDCNWNTKRKGASFIIMQDDGNLVAYDEKHNPLWSTDTYIYANEQSIYFI